eukprot:3029454-Rhodomonas_salina.1
MSCAAASHLRTTCPNIPVTRCQHTGVAANFRRGRSDSQRRDTWLRLPPSIPEGPLTLAKSRPRLFALTGRSQICVSPAPAFASEERGPPPPPPAAETCDRKHEKRTWRTWQRRPDEGERTSPYAYPVTSQRSTRSDWSGDIFLRLGCTSLTAYHNNTTERYNQLMPGDTTEFGCMYSRLWGLHLGEAILSWLPFPTVR